MFLLSESLRSASAVYVLFLHRNGRGRRFELPHIVTCENAWTAYSLTDDESLMFLGRDAYGSMYLAQCVVSPWAELCPSRRHLGNIRYSSLGLQVYHCFSR